MVTRELASEVMTNGQSMRRHLFRKIGTVGQTKMLKDYSAVLASTNSTTSVGEPGPSAR